jgi:hypothetical protein
MDHSLIETQQTGPVSDVPPEWHKPVAIGAEAPGSEATADSYMDAATGVFGSEDEAAGLGGNPDVTVDTTVIGSEALAAPDEPVIQPARVIGSLSTAQAVEPVTPPDDAEAPTDTGGPGDVPPELPPTSEGETGPQPDAALQEALNVALGSKAAIQERVNAVDPSTAAPSSTADIVNDELASARQAHAAALAAAGLDFEAKGDEELALRLTNPETFAEALAASEEPATDEEKVAIDAQLSHTLDQAIRRTSATIIASNPATTVRIFDGDMPDSPSYAGAEPTPEDAAFAESFARNAKPIIEELDRLESINNQHAEYMKLLGTAQSEGRTTEWAVGIDTQIIGPRDQRVGVDRITTDAEWDRLCAFGNHLNTVAPGTNFTRDVGDIVIEDLRRAWSEVERGPFSYPDHPPLPTEQAREVLALLDEAWMPVHEAFRPLPPIPEWQPLTEDEIRRHREEGI